MQADVLDDIVEILSTSSYQQDFRNPAPWGVSSSIIVVSDKEYSGFRIYHPTNQKTMYDLIEYVQIHGVQQ